MTEIKDKGRFKWVGGIVSREALLWVIISSVRPDDLT